MKSSTHVICGAHRRRVSRPRPSGEARMRGDRARLLRGGRNRAHLVPARNHDPELGSNQIPLPFNRKVALAAGPYWIPPDADQETVEAFRLHIENELLELTYRSFLAIGSRSRTAGRRCSSQR